MNDCDICHQPTRNRKQDARGYLLCTLCRAHIARYEAMTPAEWAEEQRMIAEYEADHLEDII